MSSSTISKKSHNVLLLSHKSLVRPHLELSVSVSSPYYSKDKQLFCACSASFHNNVLSSKAIFLT